MSTAMWLRVAASGVAGLIASVGALLLMLRGEGADFTWLHSGIRFVLVGVNPYRSGLEFGAGYLDTAPLFYPLPAVLLVAPFAGMDARSAASLWVGLSAAAVVWFGWSRPVVLLVLVSAPILTLLRGGQAGLWLLAAGLSPALAFLVVLKPSLGAGVAASWLLLDRPSWRSLLPALAVGVALVLVSFVVLPSWPLGWLRNLAIAAGHSAPAFWGLPALDNSSVWTRHAAPMWSPLGLVLFAGLLWLNRYGVDRRSWVLLVLANIPQTPMLYDAVLLWLLPRSLRGGLVLTLVSWCAFLGAQWTGWTYGAMSWWAPLVYIGALGALWCERGSVCTGSGVSRRSPWFWSRVVGRLWASTR